MTPTKLLLGQIITVFAIVLFGAWLATEWAAYRLAYQPELGPADAKLLGFRIYRPWALFGWWYHFDAYAPHIFDRAGEMAGASGIVACGAAVFGSLCLLFNPTDIRSARYNPLIEVRRGADEVRDCQNIADILVDPEGALERRSHWEKTSHSLLVGAILHILYAEEEKTLARVATFLSDPQRTFADTLKRMMVTNHLGTADAPRVHPLFLVDGKGSAQLVNYRVKGRFYVIDRLFDTAELRLGLKHQAVVRISRIADGTMKRRAS